MAQKKKSNFAGKVSSNAAKQQKAGASYGYLNLPKGISVFSPEPGGRIKLDFIPYLVTDPKHPDRDMDNDVAMPGTEWYKRPYKVHRNVGSANDSFVCLASIGKKCPICEFRAKKIKDGAEKEETDTMKPSDRNLYVVIPLDSKTHKKEMHIMDISKFLFQNLLNDELEETPDNGIFPDLQSGLTLKVRFDASTVGTSKPFAEASRIDFMERDEAYDASLSEEAPNLDEVLQILSYAELQAKFFEMEDEESGGKLKDADDDDEDEAPVKKKKPAKKEEDDDDDEDEDEAPAKKKKPVKDDDDDDDDDEDDEEEAPVRKKKTLPSSPAKKKPADDDDEDEDDDDAPATRKKKPEAVTSSRPKCPAGGKFGKDFEKLEACEKCKIWDACSDENDK